MDMNKISVPRKELTDVMNDSSKVLVESIQIAIPTCYCREPGLGWQVHKANLGIQVGSLLSTSEASPLFANVYACAIG